MFKVVFNYENKETIIQIKIEESIKCACNHFSTKINIDINELLFIYGGENLNLELTINNVANQEDKSQNSMKILVYNKKENYKEQNEKLNKSKDIICHQCGEICTLKIDNYNIILNECKNNHEIFIPFDKFDETQNIDESKIKCSKCDNNKCESYNNIYSINVVHVILIYVHYVNHHMTKSIN